MSKALFERIQLELFDQVERGITIDDIIKEFTDDQTAYDEMLQNLATWLLLALSQQDPSEYASPAHAIDNLTRTAVDGGFILGWRYAQLKREVEGFNEMLEEKKEDDG